MNTKIDDSHSPETAEPPRRRKGLAAEVARQIGDRISAAQWPVGHRIGSEGALASEFGVSRWTLREAVRILESSGLVASRKGTGGGLYVSSSAGIAISRQIANYIEFVHASGSEYGVVLGLALGVAAHIAIESRAGTIAEDMAPHIHALGAKDLAAQLLGAGAAMREIVTAAGDPALELIHGALYQVAFDSSLHSAMEDAQWLALHGRISHAALDFCQCVARGDPTRAGEAATRFGRLAEDLYSASLIYLRKPTKPSSIARAHGLFPPPGPAKKVEMVEQGIGAMIYNMGWPVNASLGSEKDLAQQFGVGRSVLREALRSLEHLGVVRTVRGSRHGVQVIAPDPRAIVEAARKHLRGQGHTADRAKVILRQLTARVDSCAGFLPIHALVRDILA